MGCLAKYSRFHFGLGLLLFVVIPTFGQNPNGPHYLGSISRGDEDVAENVYRFREMARSSRWTKADAIVLRICSSQPLPVALAAAAYDPLWVAQKIRHDTEHVVLLRTSPEDCYRASGEGTIEVWFAENADAIPKFRESYKASDLSMQTVVSRDDWFNGLITEAVTPANFLEIMKEISAVANSDRCSFIVFQVSKNPNSTRTTNLRSAQSQLIANGIPKDRMVVLFWNDVNAENSSRFPDITIVGNAMKARTETIQP